MKIGKWTASRRTLKDGRDKSTGSADADSINHGPVLCAGGFSKLEAARCDVLYVRDEAELSHAMASKPIDAVISRTMQLSGEAIGSCRTLKVISKHGAGYNNIDISAATARRIPVFYTPGANAQSVAELTLGLALAVARNIPLHDHALRNGGWNRQEIGLQLSGRTMGIVGLGNIGDKVARLATAFGMRVVGYDPKAKAMACERVDTLHALLSEAQVLSIHCPLTIETREPHWRSRTRATAAWRNRTQHGARRHR